MTGNESCDYCWGGCPGALEEAIEILRRFDNTTDRRMPPLHIVFGAYKSPIDAKPGEKVIFMGDCTEWQGKIGGQAVVINKLPSKRAKLDSYYAVHADIFGKMEAVSFKLLQARKRKYLRLTGYPVGVAEQVLLLSYISGAKNPYFDARIAFDFSKYYLGFRVALVRRMRPYQKRKSRKEQK